MTDLKIGIIGSGGRGAWLGAEAHRPNRGARIVACCDTRPEAAARDCAAFGRDVFTTNDHRELLARDLDAVIVATPDFLHETHAVAAVATGRAVYLEKPMAITIASCDRILRAAAAAGARLYLGHNLRHAPFVQKMKALIDDGAIGEVKACWVRHFVGNGGDYYFRDWHAERRYSTGLLLQKGSHDIDIIHWLCGGYSRRVSATGGLTVYGQVRNRRRRSRGPQAIDGPQVRPEIWPPAAQRGLNHRIDVEDLSHVQMQLENGVFAHYAQCHFTPDYW
ncbi:MAG TPA: Gfo/Idh/MocA family oxidoreductase, partial [Opitutus sp.]|nr:Gfo/Idh/MocA family oxidoreductase [Opitutus sp.]